VRWFSNENPQETIGFISQILVFGMLKVLTFAGILQVAPPHSCKAAKSRHGVVCFEARHSEVS